MGEDKKIKEEEKQDSSLETLFGNLETVVEKLEGADVNLEEAFQLYNEGMMLLKQCNTAIDTVEKKVLVLDEDGETHEF